MQFCPWYPLDGGAAHAPAGPGVFQVRAPELLDYPRGKTAMVHYERAADVRAAVEAFSRAHAGRGWLCRHLEDAETGSIDQIFAKLVRDFEDRFGCAPTPAPGPP
jgi:hypothetical protein